MRSLKILEIDRLPDLKAAICMVGEGNSPATKEATSLFEDANLCTIHAKRHANDIQLSNRILRDTVKHLQIGGLTKVAIYPVYTICCKRLWSVPALILGLSGIRL